MKERVQGGRVISHGPLWLVTPIREAQDVTSFFEDSPKTDTNNTPEQHLTELEHISRTMSSFT